MKDVKIISAAVAMLKVIEAYGVKQIYGYPGGSINSTLHALDEEKNNIEYIQIRHEQVGALAAAAHAKLTGKIGVAFGSAGPGAVNLLNGLYDAKEDRVPMLALVGQVGHNDMNYNYFQEMPEAPIFSDVAVYDRVIMSPESLPHVIDRAIHEAYAQKGVAVVVIPNDFGFAQIPDVKYDSAFATYEKTAPEPVATDTEVSEFLDMVKSAKRPVIHVGRGIKQGGDKLIKLSKQLQIPLIMDGLAIGLIDPNYEGNLGTANRAASKAADEILGTADLVIAIGGDFPFANSYYAGHDFKYVQIDNSKLELGRHHVPDLAIWSDATSFVEKAIAASQPVPESAFFKAAVADQKNWKAYLAQIKASQNESLSPAQVYEQVNRIANQDSIFSIDVGDNIISTFRYLNLAPTNRCLISALFATMGSGVPGAIAAKLDEPNKQVFNIAGDGALSMVMQDLVTMVKYHLPIINIVTQNGDLSFIEGEQEDLPMDIFGLDLQRQDFSMIAKGMGIDALKVKNYSELPSAFDTALKATQAGKPFLLDIEINDHRALPVEDLMVKVTDGKLEEKVNPRYLQQEGKTYSLAELFNKFDGENLKPLTDYFAEYDVKL